jgi:hypothetical protein
MEGDSSEPLKPQPLLFVDRQDRNVRYKIGRHAQLYNARTKRNEKYLQALTEKKKGIAASGPLHWRVVVRRPSPLPSTSSTAHVYGVSGLGISEDVRHDAHRASRPTARGLSADNYEANGVNFPSNTSTDALLTEAPMVLSRPQTPLNAGMSDPFQTYPIRLSNPEIDALIAHC